MNTRHAHYDCGVFIGRFQPFHIGHLHVFSEALKTVSRLIVLVGSAGGARTLRNPFTFDERVAMMRAALPQNLSERIDFQPLPDYTYNDSAWVTGVISTAEAAINDEARIALIGHDKDETTYYLQLFPHWHYVEVGNLAGINATAIRAAYLGADQPAAFSNDSLSQATQVWLQQFSQTPAFTTLAAEYQDANQFKAAWKNTPYPVIFTTVDALVRWHDEVLLIQRKHLPGKGLWALPGGFLDKDETLLTACLRELSEETQLGMDKDSLKRALVGHDVFDDPKRSSRGRVITYCYYFDISALPEKPPAQASDDAAAFEWVKLADLTPATLFEDHYFIVQALLGRG